MAYNSGVMDHLQQMAMTSPAVRAVGVAGELSGTHLSLYGFDPPES